MLGDLAMMAASFYRTRKGEPTESLLERDALDCLNGGLGEDMSVSSQLDLGHYSLYQWLQV